MTYTALPKPITYLDTLAMICFSLGCEQQRYSSSKWAPATSYNGTLPGVGQLGSDESVSSSNRTLPNRSQTLPWRRSTGSLPNRNFASQTSLPNRAAMGTLPGRSPVVVTQPKKKNAKPPLPSLKDKPVWDEDVTEKRQMPRHPGKPGLYMGQENPLAGLVGNAFGQRGSGSTLPSRGGSTLPFRRGSTLPFRGFNSSTLPGR